MVAGGGALEAYFERFFPHRESQLRKPRKRRQPLTCSSGRSLNLATTAAPPRPCVQWSAVRIKRKFCEGVLVTKVCSVFLIAALLRANTLPVATSSMPKKNSDKRSCVLVLEGSPLDTQRCCSTCKTILQVPRLSTPLVNLPSLRPIGAKEEEAGAAAARSRGRSLLRQLYGRLLTALALKEEASLIFDPAVLGAASQKRAAEGEPRKEGRGGGRGGGGRGRPKAPCSPQRFLRSGTGGQGCQAWGCAGSAGFRRGGCSGPQEQGMETVEGLKLLHAAGQLRTTLPQAGLNLRFYAAGAALPFRICVVSSSSASGRVAAYSRAGNGPWDRAAAAPVGAECVELAP